LSDNLLHFTRSNTAVNYIFKNKMIRFNSFKNVNDPRESKNWPFKLFCFYEQNYNLYNKEIFQKLHEYVMNHLFISCFALQEQENLYDSNHDLRMWSQYGEDHKGVCIVFNKQKLESQIKRHKGEFDLFHSPISYVRNPSELQRLNFKSFKSGYINFNRFIYKQILPLIHPFGKPENTDPYMVNIERLLRLGIPKYMEQHIQYYYKCLLFSKNECWKDEREYRFIIQTRDENEFIDIPIGNSIEAVIMGNDFPSSLYNDLFNFAKIFKFKVYKLYSRGWENHLFEVNIENFDEEVISIQSSHPINFYYEELFSQVCDVKGNTRVLHINSKSGAVSVTD
jgi:hypothetical protein